MDSSRSPGLSVLRQRLTFITKQPSLRSFPRQAAASLRIDRRESMSGRCTLKASLNVALGRQTAMGRPAPVIIQLDSAMKRQSTGGLLTIGRCCLAVSPV